MSRRLLWATVIGITCTHAALAIPFDNSSGGPATATVGSGGDYATLAQAAAAFNAVPSGINRPWTLEILNDLNEPTDVAIANSFGTSGSLTIRPAAATNPKVTFTSTTAAPASTAFSGHLVIGSLAVDPTGGPNAVATLGNTPSSNGRYIIDGSNTVSGTTRNLTFAVGETTATVSNMNNIIRIVGDTDGAIIRNINVIFNDTAGSYAAVGLGGAFISSTALAPDNCLIENNNFVVGQGISAGANGFGVQTTVGAVGTIPAGTAIQGLTVRGNTMTTRQRGIFLNGVGDATVERNTITIAQSNNSVLTNAIFHFNSNSATSWTQTFNRNIIDVSSTINAAGGNGTIGIFVDSGPTSGTYAITNNVVKGPFLTNPTPVDALARGISLGSATSTYLVEHNSVSVPANSASGATAGRVAALSIPVTVTTGTAVFRNNALRMGDVDGSAAVVRLVTNQGLTASGNLLFAAAGGRIGSVGAATATALADWQALGYDASVTGSQSADPFITSPGWDANLKFAGRPIQGITGVASSTILTDLDGEVRPATNAIPGADEPGPLAARANDWTLFE